MKTPCGNWGRVFLGGSLFAGLDLSWGSRGAGMSGAIRGGKEKELAVGPSEYDDTALYGRGVGYVCYGK